MDEQESKDFEEFTKDMKEVDSMNEADYKELWRGMEQVGSTGESARMAKEFLRDNHGQGLEKGKKRRMQACLVFYLKPKMVLIKGQKSDKSLIKDKDGQVKKVDERVLKILPMYNDDEIEDNAATIVKRKVEMGKFAYINNSRIRTVAYLCSEYRVSPFLTDFKQVVARMYNGKKISDLTKADVDREHKNEKTREIEWKAVKKFQLNKMYWNDSTMKEIFGL